jgi:hypothetical protein
MVRFETVCPYDDPPLSRGAMRSFLRILFCFSPRRSFVSLRAPTLRFPFRRASVV